MIASALFALCLESALQTFHILLQVGAGTGLLFILRWFWWRINALSEISAMVVSFLVAIYCQLIHTRLGLPELLQWQQYTLGVAITTVAWLTVTYLTRPTDDKKLRSFYRLTRPGGPGWKAVLLKAKHENKPIDESGEKWDMPTCILCMVFGCLAVYAALFATGSWLYMNYVPAIVLTVTAVISTVILVNSWSKLKFK
jgi:hypothetical protein